MQIEKIIDGIEFYKTKYKNVLVSKCGKIYNINSKHICKDMLNKYGYSVIKVRTDSFAKNIKAHRLIYDTFIGIKNEKNVINHKDYNKINNDINNLEEVTILENNTHLSLRKINKTSKYVGVSWDKSVKKWKSFCCISGKLTRLGNFNTELEAFNARLKYYKDNNLTNKYLHNNIDNS